MLTVPGPVRSLAFDARGRLATGSAAGDVSLFEISSGQRLRHLRQSGESVESLAFSSDGELVAAGGRDGTMQVWWTGSGALRSHPRVVARLEGHTGQVFSARWIAQGRIMTAGADGTARVWDGATGTLLQTYQGWPGFLADAILTPDAW